MITGNPEKAREFFAAKTAFTAGRFEGTGMRDRKEPVTVVDVRRPEDHAKSHLSATAPALLYLPAACRSPGAVNLPHGQWHTATGLSKDKLHVVYCHSQTCHLAALAALELAGATA